MTNKHTELPWSVINGEAVVGADKTWIKPYDIDSWEGDRKWPDRNESEANAHLIVTAVNHHEFLREALEEIVRRVLSVVHPYPSEDAERYREEMELTETARALLTELANLENGS